MLPIRRSARFALLIRVALLPIFVAAGMTINSCEVFDQIVTPAFMMSPAEEIKLGQQFAVEIEKEYKPLNDQEIVNYIRRVGQIVTANSPEKGVIPANFYVVANPEINAFAIPGGNIYVHTGLINSADDEAELASVIAHEFGHVVYRHGARHVSRSMGLSAIQQVLLGPDSAAAGQMVTGILAQGIMTNYSREDERQADSIAVPTLYAAGYDPAGMTTFFQKLIANHGDRSGPMSYFSSHPATSERISNVNMQIGALPPKQTVRPITDLRRAQVRLDQLGLGKK